ncbi:hypothetical protein E2C01_072682 [Portunus trituberculatus]|uniref:Uncharacterized protein n=1 Tax=Portunus trituberculatus TaxID=210409 RepID=A0A5B7I0P0_PORTR|nr:hypothetical protein [Portunus trituberculatus]
MFTSWDLDLLSGYCLWRLSGLTSPASPAHRYTCPRTTHTPTPPTPRPFLHTHTHCLHSYPHRTYPFSFPQNHAQATDLLQCHINLPPRPNHTPPQLHHTFCSSLTSQPHSYTAEG